MIDTLEIKQKINEIEKKSKELENILDIEKTKREILILKEKQSSSDFYKDLELAKSININLSIILTSISLYMIPQNFNNFSLSKLCSHIHWSTTMLVSNCRISSIF